MFLYNYYFYFAFFYLPQSIVRLRESGIYDQWMREALKLKGFGPDVTDEVDTDKYEFEALSVYELRGVFCLFGIGIIISIIGLAMEWIYFLFTQKLEDIIRIIRVIQLKFIQIINIIKLIILHI